MTAKPIKHDLTLYKGQTYCQNIYFEYDDGTPIPLDGITARSQVRQFKNSKRLNAEFVCTVYGSEGKVNLWLDPEITAVIPVGKYAWDLKMTDESGNVAYYIEGDFIVDGRVTE